MMKWKFLGAAVIALGFFVFSQQRKDGAHDTKAEKGSDIVAEETTASTLGSAAESPETLPFKSKLRPTHRKPTREETNDLIRNTIIPAAEFNDVPFSDVLEELNRLTVEAGIPPDQLRFICGASDVFPDDYLELRVREPEVKNIPLATLLKYILGRSKIVYVVDRGVVEFREMGASLDHPGTMPPTLPEKAYPGASDPFAAE